MQFRTFRRRAVLSSETVVIDAPAGNVEIEQPSEWPGAKRWATHGCNRSLFDGGTYYFPMASFFSRFRPAKTSCTAVPRTYLYVSDAKVDMLVEGLRPSILERFDLRLKAGLPMLSAEVSSRTLNAGRFQRAERLCAALEEEGRIGSIESGTEFFRGTMIAEWGFWSRKVEGYADVVFFSGYTGDGLTFVGLGGSAYHTMERAGERLQQYSNSGIRGLMAFLKERSETADPTWPPYFGPPGSWYAEAWDADHDNVTIPEEIDFVAQRLLDQTHSGVRAIIASPIFVARTGNPVSNDSLKEYEALRDQRAIDWYQKPRRVEPNRKWQKGTLTSPQLPPLEDPENSPAKEA